MHSIRRAVVVSCALASWVALGASTSYALEAAWTGSSNRLPTEASPPWLVYREPGSAVALDVATGTLMLRTDPASARVTYFQEHDRLAIPDELVIQARVRFVSGTSETPARAPAGIYFYPAKGIANYLWIGQDEVFVNGGARFARGAAAAVDTDGAFHDYRIEVHGKSEGSPLDVFYDNAPLLSGTLFKDDEDQEPEIAWGDIAYEASGVSEWRSFRHNAAVPEPGGVVVFGLTALVVLIRRRRTRSIADL